MTQFSCCSFGQEPAASDAAPASWCAGGLLQAQPGRIPRAYRRSLDCNSRPPLPMGQQSEDCHGRTWVRSPPVAGSFKNHRTHQRPLRPLPPCAPLCSEPQTQTARHGHLCRRSLDWTSVQAEPGLAPIPCGHSTQQNLCKKEGYDPTRHSWSRKTPPHEAGGCACNCHDAAPNGLPPRQCGPALPLFQRALSFPRPHIVHDAPRIWSCCSVEANDVTERPDVGMRSIDVDAIEYRHRCSWARFSWNSSSFDRLFRIAPDDLRPPCVSMRQKGLG